MFSSLIDHVYTNFRCEKLSVNVVNYDIPDHMPVVCEVSCEKNENGVSYQKSVQSFSKFNVGVFLNDLSVKLNKLKMSFINRENVNECWNEFERAFSSTVFFRAPIKILNKNDQKLKAKPWITKNIRVSIKKIIFKSAIKDKTKKFSTTFKNIEINLKELLSVLKDFELNQTVLSC